MRDDHLCLQMGVAIKSKQIEPSLLVGRPSAAATASENPVGDAVFSIGFLCHKCEKWGGGRVPPVAHYPG